jgi:hypothetical protein
MTSKPHRYLGLACILLICAVAVWPARDWWRSRQIPEAVKAAIMTRRPGAAVSNIVQRDIDGKHYAEFNLTIQGKSYRMLIDSDCQILREGHAVSKLPQMRPARAHERALGFALVVVVVWSIALIIARKLCI